MISKLLNAYLDLLLQEMVNEMAEKIKKETNKVLEKAKKENSQAMSTLQDKVKVLEKAKDNLECHIIYGTTTH